jgi:hypothetical protein
MSYALTCKISGFYGFVLADDRADAAVDCSLFDMPESGARVTLFTPSGDVDQAAAVSTAANAGSALLHYHRE